MRVSFTDRTIRSLAAPAKGQRDYFDKGLPGFGLRVSANGARSWIAMYRYHGRKRRVTLAPENALSLAEARGKAKNLLAKVRLGDDPAGERRAEREALTFDDLTREYLERHAKAKKRSWREDQRMLAKYVPAGWHTMKARTIARRQIRDLLDGIADRAPIQANRVLACLRKVFNFGIDREIVDANPCARVARPGAEHQRDRVLSADEVRRLWSALADAGTTGAILKLMLYTAQRRGEVKAMRWEDVDLQAHWWTVPATISKNRLSNRVPLSPPASALLRDLRANANGSPWVFPGTGASGHLETIKKPLDRVRRATGESCRECPGCRTDNPCQAPRNMVEFVPHDLRRTVATFLTSELGVSRLVVSKLLNHIETGITRVYDRASYDREKQVALAAWAVKLEQIVRGESAHAKVVPLVRV